MTTPTCAVLESDKFNTTEPQSHFIRSDNYGDDVARWLGEELRKRRVEVDEKGPEQEDHGWYTSFFFEGKEYDVVVSYLPNGSHPQWIICIERATGVLGWIFGRRWRGVAPSVTNLLKDILEASEVCTAVRWIAWKDIRRGRLEKSF